MTQPITCPACHRLRPQHSPGASFWVTAVSSHGRRRTLVDLRPSGPSVPPGQPDWGRHGWGEPPPRPLPRPLTSPQFLQGETQAHSLGCGFQVLERMLRWRTHYICRLQPVSEPEQPENFWSIVFTLRTTALYRKRTHRGAVTVPARLGMNPSAPRSFFSGLCS